MDFSSNPLKRITHTLLLFLSRFLDAQLILLAGFVLRKGIKALSASFQSHRHRPHVGADRIGPVGWWMWLHGPHAAELALCFRVDGFRQRKKEKAGFPRPGKWN